MRGDTTTTASKQAILSLLKNSSVETALIRAVMSLNESEVPKTQLRLSQFLKDANKDALKYGVDECIVGEAIRNDENAEQIRKFKELLHLLRDVSEKEESQHRKLRKGNKVDSQIKKPEWFTNITEESLYWSLVGIQLHDAPIIQKSITSFQLRNPQLRHIRFVGKLFGIERDYYVIETDHDLEEDSIDSQGVSSPKVYFGAQEQPAEEMGARGTTNHFRYWVSTSGDALSTGTWTKLPNVTPAQILTAKTIKKYLTGRLDASVESYPEFPGNEANYLRAQVARIVSATTVAPLNLYKLWTPPEDDEDDEDSPKEPVIPPVSDFVQTSPNSEDEDEESVLNHKTLQQPDSWVHLYPIILDVGRATQYKPPKVNTGDDDEEEPEDEEEDENKVQRLRPINADTPLKLPDYLAPVNKPKKDEEEEEEESADDEESELKGAYPSWSFNSFGAHDETNAVILAKSLRWPGAYAFAAENGRKSGVIYIGYGHKSEGDLNIFTPLIPEPIQQDENEAKQVDDPSVSNEKRVRDFGEEPLKDDLEAEGEGEEEED